MKKQIITVQRVWAWFFAGAVAPFAELCASGESAVDKDVKT